MYSAVGGSSPPSGSECPQCSQEVPKDNKFCNQSCAAKYNNVRYPKRRQTVRYCKNCSGRLTGRALTYCTTDCQQAYKQSAYINSWINGEIDGLSTIGTCSVRVKRWLRETRGDKCEKCGWAEVNPYTNKIPLVADHIDGEWRNNRPENLQLICPNCDSLQATYKAANKGNGREWRRK